MEKFITCVKCVPFVTEALLSIVKVYYDIKRSKLNYEEYENDVKCRIKERGSKSDLICNKNDNHG